MRAVTEFPNLSTLYLDNFWSWTFTHAKFYQEAFPIHLIQEYISRVNNLFGTSIYDLALRLQCDLLQIFLIFHVKYDFRFEAKMPADKYRVIDPFTRIDIRETNRNHEKLKNKYFNKKFNLRQFIQKMFNNFFPNVSWRYIGAGHFAHRIAIQITEYLYQLGLWSHADNEEIMKILLEKCENLNALEKVCSSDAKANKISEKFQKTLITLFSEMKFYIQEILIHSIVLSNDEQLKEQLTWTRERQGIFHDSKEIFPHVFYKDREGNNLLNTILMKTLISPHSFKVDKFFNQKFFNLKDYNDPNLKEINQQDLDYQKQAKQFRHTTMKFKMNINDIYTIIVDDQKDIF